jgi:hypothetical protein
VTTNKQVLRDVRLFNIVAIGGMVKSALTWKWFNDIAREVLDQVWVSAERGLYPLIHADALNVLAQLERDQGRREAAVAAATEAFKQAWCDEPPYAYHFA